MILHVDMDAFFAAIEQRDNPRLKGRPVIVSGHSKRSVVSTASYEARKFGICSAMPVFQAKQKCPHLIILPGSRNKYLNDSQQIMKILKRFSPVVVPVSIDEAYVDTQGCDKLFGSPKQIAVQIKTAVLNEIGLTCSVGIAPVKFLAKIASDMNKPDGLTYISRKNMDNVIATLPIKKVPGVGTQALKLLTALQIKTLGDVKHFDQALLSRKLGKMGTRLSKLSLGHDTPLQAQSVRKSISSETTLSKDIYTLAEVRKVLLEQSHRVGRDLRKKNWICRHVSIKIKFSDFSQITRSKKTESWISSSNAIYDLATQLYDKVSIKKKIRLIGVGVSDFKHTSEPVQMSLLLDRDEKIDQQWDCVDQAMDSVLQKFGSDIIKKASLNTPCDKKSKGTK